MTILACKKEGGSSIIDGKIGKLKKNEEVKRKGIHFYMSSFNIHLTYKGL